MVCHGLRPVQVLVLVLLSTLACKGLLEGWSSVPAYCPRRGRRTLACFALGFAAFPMPELFPRGCCPLDARVTPPPPLHACLLALAGPAYARTQGLRRLLAWLPRHRASARLRPSLGCAFP